MGTAPPDPALMAPPAELPPIPECEGNLQCRADYYARSRGVCAETRYSLIWLQDWVKAATAKP